MGHFDEVCLLCGVTPVPPTGFTNNCDITAEELVSELLERFPSIVDECQIEGINSKDDLEKYLAELMAEYEDYFELGDAFQRCIAIGYFSGNDGEVPCEEVPKDPIVMLRIPDGKFVTTRVVDDPECGDFSEVVIQRQGEDGVIVEEKEERLTRTRWNGPGIGNFFLSESCYLFLQAWIGLEGLPPMWDGRKLSFVGELWEVINSRETGRNSGGWLDWLEPGGAEKKLDQTQGELSNGGILSFSIADALREGWDRERIKIAMLDDYGLWMFATPHEWPSLSDQSEMAELTNIGFDVPLLSTSSSSSLGSLSRFSPEVLVQIFGWLSTVGEYIKLKTVSQRMHDLITSSQFTAMVFREMLQPNPNRALFWVHPIDQKPEEHNDFVEALKTWTSSDSQSNIVSEQLVSSPGFPIVQFIYAVLTEDPTRNRRRLWNNVKWLREVWADYRLNGWKVNRFGVAYPRSVETGDNNE
ncbi:hypothetical protein D9756_010768 [Leucocoprinus leucothites]|uniref:F-box domain-containing protein n=1 Tax=Leucocoprinus leucothites TaxID=201217 RepID=A0A8H5CU50_9AGAR|nr:hypothetical protein D9756_010768 [Leucoagaricus leucothites]